MAPGLSIAVLEGLEHPLLVARGQAGTIMADGEAGLRAAGSGYPDVLAAMDDGVGHQVAHDLAHPHGVAHCRGGRGLDLESAGMAVPEPGQGPAHLIGQVEGRGDHPQGAGVGLGGSEQVLDDIGHVLCLLLDHGGHLGLVGGLGGERLVEHMGVAHDGGQGVAEFVAHGADQFDLRSQGGLDLLAVPLLVGHVLELTLVVGHPAAPGPGPEPPGPGPR